MRPMLATPCSEIPGGDGWWHEVKWDGMRLLADVRDHRVRLTTRTERDVTGQFRELTGDAAGLTAYADLLVDGELVAMAGGRPSFSALAHRARAAAPHDTPATLTYVVFDVLRAAGADVTRRPLRERRELLEGIELPAPAIHVPPVFADGPGLLEATADRELEGVVSKRVESVYRPGRRSADWCKVVHRHADSFVLGGMRRQQGGRGLGAVLLGSPTPDGLMFRGRVGAGLAGAAGERLLATLSPLTSATCPFTGDLPATERAGTTWLRPDLVADVAFLSTSPGGRLRMPTWRGLRADLAPRDLSAVRRDHSAGGA